MLWAQLAFYIFGGTISTAQTVAPGQGVNGPQHQQHVKGLELLKGPRCVLLGCHYNKRKQKEEQRT